MLTKCNENYAMADPLPFIYLEKFQFAMIRYSYFLILLFILSAPMAQAGSVEKCVDSTGKITYTDKGCKGKETSENTYLGGSVSGKKGQSRLQKTSITGYKISEIGFLTEQAVEQCSKQAGKFFTDSRPGVAAVSDTEFVSVLDRAIRGAKVEITLAGVIRYQGEKATEKEKQEMKIQCTASRSRETEWELVFKEASTGAGSTTAKAKTD
jgi:hypothetical protein